ncbi:MAG: hypothetical protein K0S12_686 [Bacteroidetes bacterium]|nr:hypothetical protein [Bacteroidota bacterium]
MGCFIGIAVMVFVAGFVGVMMFTVRKQVSSGFNTIMSGWQSPTISQYLAFATNKGPVVWEILEQSGTKLDSARHTLRIIDPLKNKIISENPFGETTTWHENFNFGKRIGYDFLLVNDTLYNGSEDGGLQAFDPYTGKKLLSNADLEKKFPRLKDGIAKVESRAYNGEFVLYTNAGDEFHYFPERHLLRNEEEETNSYKTDTATRTNFYLTGSKKSELYLITKKERGNEISTVPEHLITGYLKDRRFNNHFKKLQKVNDKVYPCAQRLISTKDFAVLVYLSDFSKKAFPIIEKIDADGKTVWQNKDTVFKFFIQNFSSDNLSFDYTHSPKEIVFHETNGEHRSIGLDLASGKTLFVHRQGYKVD